VLSVSGRLVGEGGGISAGTEIRDLLTAAELLPDSLASRMFLVGTVYAETSRKGNHRG